MPEKESLLSGTLLITGGTGFFGQHFVAAVIERFAPERLIVFSRDEYKQYQMQQDARFGHSRMRYFLGDVRDESRLEMAMRGVDVVVHAAALKQVPAAEYNPFECIQTNVHGAENVVRAALKAGVKRIVALSTDKACNPVNLYGASKLASDKIFIAGNNLVGKQETRFSVVRYGNVVGSRGSVIPLFANMLKQGAKSLPITDPNMTRFWITAQQGVDFVISSIGMMGGGEIFVPKIPSMRVADLAKAMAPNVPTHVIGIRPGEKLHEMMVAEDDARMTLEMADRYVIEPSFSFWSRGHLNDSATRVPPNFCYRSDTNSQWLDAASLQKLLADK